MSREPNLTKFVGVSCAVMAAYLLVFMALMKWALNT